MANSECTPENLEALIETFRTGNHTVKQKVFKALEAYPFEDIREVLFESLEDQHHRVRSTAGKLLGEKGDETVISPLLHLLFDDSWIIRSSAQDALSHLPEDLAIPTFKGILASPDGDVNLRKNIAGVLSKYSSKDATELLIQLFVNSREERLRATLADYLGKRHDEEAIKTLFDALGDESWNVRNAASKALSSMDLQAILDRSLKALYDPNRFIHMAVVEMLIRCGSDDVIDAMAEVLSSGNTLARYNALNILSGIQTEESLSMALSALNDSHASVRNRAMEVLSDSKIESIFDLLIRCTKSKNWNLKRGAIMTIGMIGSERALDTLEDLLAEDTTAVKITILEVLAKIDNRRAMRLITKNISLPELGESAINIIRSLDPDIAIKHLISFLTDGQSFPVAVKALNELDEDKVLRALSSRISSGTPQQQVKCVEAMGLIGSNKAETFLKKFEGSGMSGSLKSAINTALRRIQKKIP